MKPIERCISLLKCVLVLGVTSACDKREPEDSVPGAVAVGKVRADPGRYYGKQVTVSGEVTAVYSPQAFLLEGKGLHWGDDVYVLTKSPIKLGGAPLKEDDDLIVNGVVHRFVKADLERELGWSFDPVLEAKLREEPVVVAAVITKIDRYAWM
jgi:hypothetical protein